MTVAVWVLACALLAAVGVLTATHYIADHGALRRHLVDPTTSHFYGAPTMALMTVGTGTLLVGVRVVGEHAATAIDCALWAAGTALGLATAVAIPALQFTRPLPNPRDASAVWLMPVVPPMVSAATVPTLWIVLGPLDQSVTAAGLLADHAAPTLGVTRHVRDGGELAGASHRLGADRGARHRTLLPAVGRMDPRRGGHRGGANYRRASARLSRATHHGPS